MKLSLYQKCELVGLALVLFATTFQLTFLTTVTDISNDSALYRIEEKLEMVWRAERGLTSAQNIEDTNAEVMRWYGLAESSNYADRQKERFEWFYAVLMIPGSFLLVLGRWLEMKRSK